jgi:hypothetical protein
VTLSLPTQHEQIYFPNLAPPLVTFDVAQAKERSHCNQHPIDQFLPLVMEVFGCLHKQIDVFLHNCANAIWSSKGVESLSLFVLVTFLWQKNSITLQRLQDSSILI